MPSPSSLTGGLLVTPNVRLKRPLGEGGMGSVWVADHLGLDIEVAVKFIHAEALETNPSLQERFKLEASLAAKMKSPHAVQVLDHGCMEDGTPFIVMELLEGESLADKLEIGPLRPREVALLVAQIAEVLDRAHSLRVVHRDLKPDNLFLIESGYELFVKLLDFGVAKQTGLPEPSMTTTGAMVGTPVYMSPELIESAKDADHFADLWALAVLAYECLVIQMPFSGETLGALCIAISKAEFVAPSTHVPEFGPNVDAWFARALARDQNDRFQSARELATAFANAIGESNPAPSLPAVDLEEVRKSAAPTEVSAHHTVLVDQTSATQSPARVSPTGHATEVQRTLSPASTTMAPPTPRKPRPWGWVAAFAAIGLALAATPKLFGSATPATATPSAPAHSVDEVHAAGGVDSVDEAGPVPTAESDSTAPTAESDAAAATDAKPEPTSSALASPSASSSHAVPETSATAHVRGPRPSGPAPKPSSTPSDTSGNSCFYMKDGKWTFRSDKPACKLRKQGP